VNIRNNEGWTPLMLAIKQRFSKDIIKFIALRDNNINAKTKDGLGIYIIAENYGGRESLKVINKILEKRELDENQTEDN
jgi:ankyrin repeat protein